MNSSASRMTPTRSSGTCARAYPSSSLGRTPLCCSRTGRRRPQRLAHRDRLVVDCGRCSAARFRCSLTGMSAHRHAPLRRPLPSGERRSSPVPPGDARLRGWGRGAGGPPGLRFRSRHRRRRPRWLQFERGTTGRTGDKRRGRMRRQFRTRAFGRPVAIPPARPQAPARPRASRSTRSISSASLRAIARSSANFSEMNVSYVARSRQNWNPGNPSRMPQAGCVHVYRNRHTPLNGGAGSTVLPSHRRRDAAARCVARSAAAGDGSARASTPAFRASSTGCAWR